MNYAILKDKQVVTVDDLIDWAKWFEENRRSRHVGDYEANGIRVSTVFLGLDHSFMSGRPQWFETMIFGGEHDGYQDRYSTWKQAEDGHRHALELAGLVQ